jgi:protein-L-isoaspartate O-methyltransferase
LVGPGCLWSECGFWRQGIESAKQSFERDLLTPSYAQIISDEEDRANIIKYCDLISGKSYLDIGTGSGYIAFELYLIHIPISPDEI